MNIQQALLSDRNNKAQRVIISARRVRTNETTMSDARTQCVRAYQTYRLGNATALDWVCATWIMTKAGLKSDRRIPNAYF